MRRARVLRAELELWKVAWQQVETFLQQIDGAQEKDGTERRRLDGLLHLARVVEHHRALADPSMALGDPVVTRLPVRAYRPSDSVTEESIAAWDEKLRVWRLPGADEVELAVALLDTDDDGALEAVQLPGRRTIVQARDDAGDLTTLVLPSYPGEDDTVIVTPALPPPSIAAGKRGSLFTRDERRDATLAPPGDGTDESPLRSWTTLTRARRVASRPTSGEDAARLSSDRATGGPPWGQAVADPVPALAAAIAAVVAAPTPPAGALTTLRTLATQALAVGAALADGVAAAKTASDDDGFADAELTAAIDAAAAAVVDPQRAIADAVDAVDRLLAAPSSSTARADLAAAGAVLARPRTLPDVLFGRVADDPASPLGRELDAVVAARVGYPDGTLRALRTLETGFVAAWPGMRRWFVLRHAAVLAPSMRALLQPFVAGLGALLRGGFTGLPADGLRLAAPTPVGAEQVDLVQPASMVAMLTDLLEPGHLAIVAGERPAPLVVLGVQARLGQASLHTAPLRLSMASPAAAPGAAGTAPAEAELGRVVARGLTARELRRGRSDDGPGHDALPAEALALFSRLALLVGTDAVERLLQGLPDGAPLGARLVPVPALPGGLAGTVPAYATSLVLHGLGPAFWAAPGQDGVPADAAGPEPRLARPGELLLLRGQVVGDGGAAGALVQAPVEVDDVLAVTGRALARMDTSRAAVLSTSAAALPDPAQATADGAPLVCGPDEPLTVVLLRRSWAREALVAEVSLARTFRGFDAPSLAARTLLPLDLVARILRGPAPDEPGVGRAHEFAAALETLDAWTRYGR